MPRMANKPPYHAARKGRLYFEPRPDMRERGWQGKGYGIDDSTSRAVAWKWWETHKLDIRYGEPTQIIQYPSGSMGEAWHLMTGTKSLWEAKSEGTRAEWLHVWNQWIEPEFGHADPRTLSIWNVEALCAERTSRHQVAKLLKVWRAFWRIMESLKYADPGADPSRAFKKPTIKGRSQSYSYVDVSRLVKAAWRGEDYEIAAIMAVMWDTQFMPVDVRTLVATQRQGRKITRSRAKTGTSVVASLSRNGERILDAYLARRDAALIGEARLFTYSKSWLSHRFTKLRRQVFDTHDHRDNRTMQDIRRSGAIEATAGGVDPHALSKTMGNSYENSQKLQETYSPSNVVNAEHVLEARRKGRKRLKT